MNGFLRTCARTYGVVLLFLLIAGVTTAPAAALGQGSIDHVEPGNDSIRILYSVPATSTGLVPDLDSIEVMVDGQQLRASASLASEGAEPVRRTTVLAIDVSESMDGEKFQQAKLAANVFLDTVPEDVYVGIVTFAGAVEIALAPTLDRNLARAAVDGLSLERGTRLYDGVVEAVDSAGTDGQRTVLVLSDGRDTSDTPIDDAATAVAQDGVQLDVVAVGQQGDDLGALAQLTAAGTGSVSEADTPKGLSDFFAAEADALARQVLVKAVPLDDIASEGSLTVAVTAGGETYSDTAFVSFDAAASSTRRVNMKPIPVTAPRFLVSENMMLAGLGVAAMAMLILLLMAFGALEKKQTETLEDRIAAYSLTKDYRSAAGKPGVHLVTSQERDGLAGSAVGAAQKALSSNKGLEASLGSRLEGAGMAMKPAEWLLLHSGIAMGAGLAGFLLSAGGIVISLLLLLLGAVAPWLFLGMKRSRRLKSFDGQLADVLQLMSGSLSAGLSLAQSADTVVREGTEPVAGEFRRALIEARLGVQIEDALDSVAERMESDDFHWVVMAVRIQREVGGNLAELLLTVAATLREREYLRRQVKALSAEGRMSAWILGGLPPGFMAYLSMVNPDYLTPMFSTPLGWFLLGTMAFMLALGVFWMSKMVKVEV